MTESPTARQRLSDAQLLQLRRWNTPTIYNGWEQITRHPPGRDGFNIEETRDFMPQMGPMAGYAVTVVCRPSDPGHRQANPNAWGQYRDYVGSFSGPKIVVVQDLDKPAVFGVFWGEVNSLIHRALGCVGTITDGGIRDLDEMNNVGFKALARRLWAGLNLDRAFGGADHVELRLNPHFPVYGCFQGWRYSRLSRLAAN